MVETMFLLVAPKHLPKNCMLTCPARVDSPAVMAPLCRECLRQLARSSRAKNDHPDVGTCGRGPRAS